MQALANGQIQATNMLDQHIAHCLGCQNCERVCPSGVDYGYLLDHSRQLLRKQNPMHGLRKHISQIGLKLARHRRGLRYLQWGIYFYQKTGLQRLFRISGLLQLLRLKRFDRLLPRITSYQAFESQYPAVTPSSKGRLGLFIGCTGNLFDQSTLQQTIRLLQGLGYEVVVPPQQTCCGALHQHQGQLETANSLAKQNIQAFAELDTLIYIASGCGAQLRNYARLSWPDAHSTEQAKSFSKQTREITAFLSDEDLSAFQFRPLNRRVAIHTPCSMRNGLRQLDASATLLANIPQLKTLAIPADTGCCGAAGSYMLSQGSLADAIRQNTLDVITDFHADIVSTTNIGCGLHIHAGLNNKTSYTHPVSLLVNQISF